MDKPASRWLQRFQSFEKAFLRLKEAIEIEKLNELERNGLIQRFEFTMDLSWKVMKDFLEYKGFAFKPSSPKDTIRLAQQSGYIHYAQALIDGLDLRNELSHDYSEQKFLDAEAAIRKEIYPFLEKIYYFYLNEKQHDSNG